MIKVQHLHKYFFRHKKNEIHVLNDMTLDFPQSGLVVLLGPSGSGKTTLLNVIGGLDNIQQGVIQFDDHLIKGYPSKLWDKIRNEKIGYIFQNYNLLPQLSVYDNIALVLKMMGINDPEIIEKRVHYMLNAVNMYPYRKKKSTQLSGGQQQRVAIARALVKNPEVIIADEPTGNLDSKNTLDIMNIIKEISKNKLVILVTHEKDIANIYSDRIIEIKDGQIVNDFDNESDLEHTISDENTIYLKDLDQLSEIKDDRVSLNLYNDSKTALDPIKVRLIVKNRTLYLDVDSTIQKVRLIEASSNLLIKDEHYVKKTKEEMLETKFKTENLDNSEVHRSYKTVVSLRSIFMLALQKILYTSRKGKIMLFSFIIAGAVVAMAVSLLAATLIPDYSSRALDDGYVQYSQTANNVLTYQELLTLSGNDSSLYVNNLGSVRVTIIDPLDRDRALLNIDGTMDIMEHAPSKMVIGTIPQNDYDIVLTKALADSIIERNGPEYGIWSYAHLLIEDLRIGDIPVSIAGIVDSELSIVYMQRSLTNLIEPGVRNTTVAPIVQVYYVNDLYLDYYDITHGTAPTASQIAISIKLFDQLSSEAIGDVTFPLTFDGLNYPVSGVFDDDSNDMAIASDTVVEQLRFVQNSSYYIYSSNPKALITALEGQDYEAVDLRTQIREIFYAATMEVRITMITVTIVVGALTLVGFYLIMHSSMVSRIYEISVYRALGMKRSELFVSFLIEVIIISSVTSLVGFVVASIGLIRSSDSLLGMFRIFLVTPLSVLVGIIALYLINIMGGMFPILLLLRKTPAQILAQYDI